MTDHYREAGRLISEASFQRHGSPCYRDGTRMLEATRTDMVARAQVHATLAVADWLGELLAQRDGEPSTVNFHRDDADADAVLDPAVEAAVADTVRSWVERPNCPTCAGSGKRPGMGEEVRGDAGSPFGWVEGKLVPDADINSYGWSAILTDRSPVPYAVYPDTVTRITTDREGHQ